MRAAALGGGRQQKLPTRSPPTPGGAVPRSISRHSTCIAPMWSRSAQSLWAVAAAAPRMLQRCRPRPESALSSHLPYRGVAAVPAAAAGAGSGDVPALGSTAVRARDGAGEASHAEAARPTSASDAPAVDFRSEELKRAVLDVGVEVPTPGRCHAAETPAGVDGSGADYASEHPVDKSGRLMREVLGVPSADKVGESLRSSSSSGGKSAAGSTSGKRGGRRADKPGAAVAKAGSGPAPEAQAAS